MYTAASAVRWLQELGVISSATDLDLLAVDDAGGALVRPGIGRVGGAVVALDATASFTGLSLGTTRGIW